MRVRISSQIREIFQGILAGVGWKEREKRVKEGYMGPMEETGSDRPRPEPELADH